MEATITFYHGGNPGRDPRTWKAQAYLEAGSGYQVLLTTTPYALTN